MLSLPIARSMSHSHFETSSTHDWALVNRVEATAPVFTNQNSDFATDAIYPKPHLYFAVLAPLRDNGNRTGPASANAHLESVTTRFHTDALRQPDSYPKLLSSIPFFSANPPPMAPAPAPPPCCCLPTASLTAFSRPDLSPVPIACVASLNAPGSLCAKPNSVVVPSWCSGVGCVSGGSSRRHKVGRRMPYPLGLCSGGSDVEYVTRALMTSRSSSSCIAVRPESDVADWTTMSDRNEMSGESRFSARCCKIEEGVGLEFTGEDIGRSEAKSSVDAQWTAVSPSWTSATAQKFVTSKGSWGVWSTQVIIRCCWIATSTHFRPFTTCTQVLPNHIRHLLHHSPGQSHTTWQTREDKRYGQKVVLDFCACNGVHTCSAID